jgi:NAD(P)-dependent dehydrogenase (short-subunit alcohol dehydrogenase family)
LRLHRRRGRATGSIDILVNNAAAAPGRHHHREPASPSIVALNLLADLCPQRTNHWMQQGDGSIVNISSVSGMPSPRPPPAPR